MRVPQQLDVEDVTGQVRSRLRLLQDVARALVEAHTTEQMTHAVVDAVARQPGVASSRIYLLDEDEVLRSAAWIGGPSDSDAFDEILLAADLPASEVARTGIPAHAADMSELYERYPAFAAVSPYPAANSLHLVPLRVEGTTIGVFKLGFRPGVVADADQRAFVTAIADTLAQAIERGRVRQRIEAERQRELNLLTAQADALAEVLAGAPLVDVLDDLLRSVEAASPDGVLASVLLVDDDGRRLRHGAAPSLPADYNAAVDGLHIGPQTGSCGTAAYRASRVVVTDIETDPLWADYRELARRAGVRACWSTPVMGGAGDLLGTFALYYRTPRRPDAGDLAAIDVLVGTVALLIDRSRAQAPGARLQEEAVRRLGVELAVQAGGVGTFDWDLATGALTWDEQLLEIFGMQSDQRLVIEDFLAAVHPADRDRVRAQLDRAAAELVDFVSEYRIVLPDGGTRWVAARGRPLVDRNGRALRLIGAAQDTTARRDTEAQLARVLDSLSTAFFFVDSAWRFVYVNAEAERILGRPRGTLVGKDLWSEFPGAQGTAFEVNYRTAAETGEPVAFDAYYPEPLRAWYEVRAWPSSDGLAVYFLDVTDRRAAQQTAQRAIDRAGLLARVSEELAGTMDRRESMRRLAQVAVPMLADWCVVTLIDDDRTAGTRRGLGEALGWHTEPELRGVVEDYAQTRLEQMTDHSVVRRAVETAEPQILNGSAMAALTEMFEPGSAQLRTHRELDTHAAVVLPLTGEEQPVGMLSVVNTSARGTFTDEDLDLLRDIAARAGLVLDRARLYRQQRAVAETLQRSLLTSPQPRPGARMSVAYVPAAEVAQVGGDWYDAFQHPDGATTLVIGDVMGHDLLAAAAMGETRTFVRAVAAKLGGDPARTLDDAESVMRMLDSASLATLFVGKLGPVVPGADGLDLDFAAAGHPPPIVLHPDGRAEPLYDEATDSLLGIGLGPHRQHSRRLEDGAVLVLYTDGLVERRDQPADEGILRLCAALTELRGGTPDEVRDGVLERLLPERAEDDVAVLVVGVDLAHQAD